MKMLVLPGAAFQNKQSCLFPNHRYLFPTLFLVPAHVFLQQGSKSEQTKAMKLVCEGNKAWIYLGQEQAPSVEKGGWHSFSLKCLWKSGWKITKVRGFTVITPGLSGILGICVIGLGWSERWDVCLSVRHEGAAAVASCNWQCSYSCVCCGLSYVSKQSSKRIHLDPKVLGTEFAFRSYWMRRGSKPQCSVLDSADSVVWGSAHLVLIGCSVFFYCLVFLLFFSNVIFCQNQHGSNVMTDMYLN